MILTQAAVWRREGYLIWRFRVLYTRVEIARNALAANPNVVPTLSRGPNGEAALLMTLVVEYPVTPEMDAHLRSTAEANVQRHLRDYSREEDARHALTWETSMMNPSIARGDCDNNESLLLQEIEAWMHVCYPRGMNAEYDANGDIFVVLIRPLLLTIRPTPGPAT